MLMESDVTQVAICELAERLSDLAKALVGTGEALLAVAAATALASEHRRSIGGPAGEIRGHPGGTSGAASEIRPLVSQPPLIPPLEFETRVAVDTRTAAFHINRREQTLRAWACRENGPIRPFRINGRLAWPVEELRRVLRTAKNPT